MPVGYWIPSQTITTNTVNYLKNMKVQSLPKSDLIHGLLALLFFFFNSASRKEKVKSAIETVTA